VLRHWGEVYYARPLYGMSDFDDDSRYRDRAEKESC